MYELAHTEAGNLRCSQFYLSLRGYIERKGFPIAIAVGLRMLFVLQLDYD